MRTLFALLLTVPVPLYSIAGHSINPASPPQGADQKTSVLEMGDPSLFLLQSCEEEIDSLDVRLVGRCQDASVEIGRLKLISLDITQSHVLSSC